MEVGTRWRETETNLTVIKTLQIKQVGRDIKKK